MRLTTAERCRVTERGTSLTEVMTVVAISALLIVPLLTILRSSVAVEADQTERIDQLADLDRAFDQLGTDIRRSRLAVTGNGPVGSGSSSDEVLMLERFDSTGAVEIIRWRFDGDHLVRFRIQGASDLERDRADVLVDADETVVPFRFLDDSGDPLDSRALSAARLAACATAVEIDLAATGIDRRRAESALFALGHRADETC